MKDHVIKLKDIYFNEVLSGNKKFEIRNNDRDYKQGDALYLLEITEEGSFTQREMIATVGYVCDYEQKQGYVVFSLIDPELN